MRISRCAAPSADSASSAQVKPSGRRRRAAGQYRRPGQRRPSPPPPVSAPGRISVSRKQGPIRPGFTPPRRRHPPHPLHHCATIALPRLYLEWAPPPGRDGRGRIGLPAAIVLSLCRAILFNVRRWAAALGRSAFSGRPFPAVSVSRRNGILLPSGSRKALYQGWATMNLPGGIGRCAAVARCLSWVAAIPLARRAG